MLLLAPTITVLACLSLYPMVYSFVISMYQWDFGKFIRFVGLRNYLGLLANPDFFYSLRVTAVIVFSAVIVEFVLGLLLALAANRPLGRLNGIIRTLLIIPMFTAPILVGIVWRMLWNSDYGLFAWLINRRGTTPLASPWGALFAVALADVWQWTPFMFLIFLAALQGVPLDTVEAATADGASGARIVWSIQLPQIRYAIGIAILLRFMDAIKLYDPIYTLTYGGPGRATENATYVIFKTGFQQYRMQDAAAYSWVLVIVLTGLTMLFLRLMQKGAD